MQTDSTNLNNGHAGKQEKKRYPLWATEPFPQQHHRENGGGEDLQLVSHLCRGKGNVVKDPVVKDPVFRNPVAKDPVVEHPVVKDPVVKDPVGKDPVVKDPVIKILLLKIL